MESQFRKQSMDNVSRFSAVRSFDNRIFRTYSIYFQNRRWFMPNLKHRHRSRLGVYISHVEVLREYMEQDEEGEPLLVLEDDTVLADNFPDLVDEAVRVAPEDWEVLFLSSADRINGKPVSAHYVKPHPGHLPKTNHGMFCYLVRSRDVAKKMLSVLLPIDFKLKHVDHVLREHYGTAFNAYYLIQRIAKHRDDIKSDRESSGGTRGKRRLKV